ncbi:hypothetical protein CP967_08560 [Streptomyces nitrosporeus]|uniref:Uncharacterized protein n=1 Tax=Streptomyces nitrosporeus TaxID=28894 RepID=A0A5J6F7R9_9ACTN|nr:hypothetical protein [Streptomyces nitrosporeus]QEU72013.1 hypothetical protein CP967_08560 [Streptomyces nitrosporeus]GGY81271.1 hypothetical protein GCM10010327_09890 [Streptomyces nitrosporeus]
MSAVLTMSGAALSVGVLAVNVRSWWKGSREIKTLVPFGGGLIHGGSWTLCVGGLLGWVQVRTVDAGSSVGDWGVTKVTGTGGGALTAGSMGTLTPAGATVVVIALIIGAITFKAAGKADKKKIIGGLFVGHTLTATAGFAQLMQWLPDTYNAVGAGLQDVLNGVLPL